MTPDARASDPPRYDASAEESYRRFWQRALVFTGRAGRAEYWWPLLLNGLASIALVLGIAVLLGVRGLLGDVGLGAIPAALAAVLGLLLALFVLAQIVPSIAVAVRRLHDVDLPGLLVLIALVPSVGAPTLLVLHALRPNPAGSRFDAVPQPAGALPAPSGPRRLRRAAGADAEVYLAGDSLRGVGGIDDAWAGETVAAVARRIGTSGRHLPAELEQYGALSMTLTGIAAPAELLTPQGGLGVLIGLPVDGLPRTVATPAGEVRLASITPLTPDELQQILDGGAAARTRIAERLVSGTGGPAGSAAVPDAVR